VRLSKAVDQYLAYVRGERTVASWKRYRCALFPFLRVAGNKDLSNIGPPDVTAYRQCCAEKGNSLSTILSNVKLLSGFWKWLIDQGYTEKYPIRQIHRKKAPPPAPPRILTGEEWDRLEAACQRVVYKRSCVMAAGFLAMLRYMGLRKGEIQGALIADLDVVNLTLRVMGKGRKVRIMPMPERALPVITAAAEESRHSGSEFILSSRTGEQIGQAALHRFWKELLHLAGLPSTIRIHDGRHSYAVLAAESEVPVPIVQALLGHARIDTTQRYLVGLDVERAKPGAVKKMFGEKKGGK
jgi:integrase